MQALKNAENTLCILVESLDRSFHFDLLKSNLVQSQWFLCYSKRLSYRQESFSDMLSVEYSYENFIARIVTDPISKSNLTLMRLTRKCLCALNRTLVFSRSCVSEKHSRPVLYLSENVSNYSERFKRLLLIQRFSDINQQKQDVV